MKNVTTAIDTSSPKTNKDNYREMGAYHRKHSIAVDNAKLIKRILDAVKMKKREGNME